MHVIRQPNGKWKAQVRRTINGEKVSKTKTFGTKLEAQAWGFKQETSLETTGFTMAQALEEYKRQKIDAELATKTTDTGKTTHAKRLNLLWHLQIRLRSYTIESFGPVDAKMYRDMRLKSVAPETVRKELYFISGLYEWLKEEYLMYDLKNPIKDIKLPPPGPKREVTHKPNEKRDLMAELSGQHKVVYELLLETAMRLSEVLFLEAEWIEVERSRVWLPQDITKTKKARTVPLTDRAMEILIERLRERPEGRLFDLKYDTFRRRFARAKKKLGLDHLRLHDCRHTAISRFARKAPNLMHLQRISGHASMESLKRYTHLDDDDVRSWMN